MLHLLCFIVVYYCFVSNVAQFLKVFLWWQLLLFMIFVIHGLILVEV